MTTMDSLSTEAEEEDGTFVKTVREQSAYWGILFVD